MLLFTLPLVAVILLTTSGINVVSNLLVTVNPSTQTVQIHNPNGTVTNITRSMEWPVSGVVTLEFGQPDLPYQLFHSGIDIANPNGKIGDPIVPLMDGKVTYAASDLSGYGEHIIIDHGNNVSSLYGHLSAIYVYPGEWVHLKQVIGEEGQTGWATGPHLHFQINVYNIPINPRTFLTGNP